MSPTDLDDTLRGIMASVKRYANDIGGAITSAGTADALTITTGRVISTGHQAAGFSVRFKAGNTNTGAATVAVDGLSAASIKRMNGDALSSGDIVTGGIYDIAFDGTNYILLGAGGGSGTYGTLTGNNTWSGVNTFGGTTTIGDGAGDVVTIKGTVVDADISALFDAASVDAFGQEIIGAFSSTTTADTFVVGQGTYKVITAANAADALLDALGSEVKGALIYHNGTGWAVLAPP